MSADIGFKAFSVGNFGNNAYILIDPSTNESVLFDAPTDADRIMRELADTQVKYILMTHADPDHIQALQEVRTKTKAPVGIHASEASRLPAVPDFQLSDRGRLRFGNREIKTLHTPGHTPGGMSFILDDMALVGDTLFPGGPGNTERPFASFEQIIDSIRTKLFVLPDETRVYPGHGKPTTIGAEKPHLQEWIDRGW